MKIYNSYTGKLETFKPIKEKELSMYVCGPTIYSDIHIGNLRPLIFFDIVARFFKLQGYKVHYISNITDIDDKIINKAHERNITEKELVRENLSAYLEVCKKVQLNSFSKQPCVTNYIQEIINYIQVLLDMGYAYNNSGNVYFDTQKIKSYGKLSNLNIEQIKIGEKNNSNMKKNSTDFTLWKNTTKGITWDAPFGPGRPGWHTECVVMINQLLGKKIDIHGGGIDLKFPHHENENAQSCAINEDLANYWLYNGFINYDGQKMSKSIGNTILAKDFIDKYEINVVRLIMLQTHYSQPLNLDEDLIEQTIKLNERFKRYYDDNIDDNIDDNTTNILINNINNYMNNDFATANVITIMQQIIKDEVNLENIMAMKYACEILGLDYPKINHIIPNNINELIKKRQIAKKNKDFELADKLRETIYELGYEILEQRNGVKCKKIMKK